MLGKKDSSIKKIYQKNTNKNLKDDLVNPNGAFTIPTPPSSDDENDEDLAARSS